MDIEIKRGDILFANLDPVVGSEQGGIRPVLVIQNDTGNRRSGTTIVAAITNRRKPSLPAHVQIPWTTGLDERSIILLEQLRTIDKTRFIQKIGTLGSHQMQPVDLALMTSLGIRNALPDCMVMTLCRVCAQAFRDSNDHLLRRADFNQEVRERCTMCNARTGYDYEVIRL